MQHDQFFKKKGEGRSNGEKNATRKTMAGCKSAAGGELWVLPRASKKNSAMISTEKEGREGAEIIKGTALLSQDFGEVYHDAENIRSGGGKPIGGKGKKSRPWVCRHPADNITFVNQTRTLNRTTN